jgi:hypothetical protein
MTALLDATIIAIGAAVVATVFVRGGGHDEHRHRELPPFIHERHPVPARLHPDPAQPDPLS